MTIGQRQYGRARILWTASNRVSTNVCLKEQCTQPMHRAGQSVCDAGKSCATAGHGPMMRRILALA